MIFPATFPRHLKAGAELAVRQAQSEIPRHDSSWERIWFGSLAFSEFACQVAESGEWRADQAQDGLYEFLDMLLADEEYNIRNSYRAGGFRSFAHEIKEALTGSTQWLALLARLAAVSSKQGRPESNDAVFSQQMRASSAVLARFEELAKAEALLAKIASVESTPSPGDPPTQDSEVKQPEAAAPLAEEPAPTVAPVVFTPAAKAATTPRLTSTTFWPNAFREGRKRRPRPRRMRRKKRSPMWPKIFWMTSVSDKEKPHPPAPAPASATLSPPSNELVEQPASAKSTLLLPFARNIDKFRLNCGWSLDDLVEKTKMDKKVVHGHIHGKKKPRPSTFKVYADVFSKFLGVTITVTDLLEE
jgi:hypothetical protein